MNSELITAYRIERAAHPYLSASQCLKMAQYNLRMKRAELPRYTDSPVIMELPRGEYIELKLEADDEYRGDDEYTLDDVSRYADITGHARSGWLARDGRVLFDSAGNRSSRYRWQWWTDNYGFAQMWEDGKREHSRHDAWLRARELVAQSFKVYTEAREDGYVGYVVTLHGADGEELEQESVWGFEATGDYAGQEAFAAARGMASERAKYWKARTAEAKRDCIALRKRFGDDASEYRFLRASPDAARLPSTCETVRDRLAQLRARHRDALRVVLA